MPKDPFETPPLPKAIGSGYTPIALNLLITTTPEEWDRVWHAEDARPQEVEFEDVVPDRYVPDFAHVPPDPADPVPVVRDASGRWVTVGDTPPQPRPVDHPDTGWRGFPCVADFVEEPAAVEPWPPVRPGHLSISSESGKVTISEAVWDMAALDALIAEHKARFTLPPRWPDHFSEEHEDALRWKREGRFARVCEPAPEAPADRDPRLAGIDALIDYASRPDASLVPTPRPLILTREQGNALLRALYRSGAERVRCTTAASGPADCDPPLTGKQARTMIADDLVPYDPWTDEPPRNGKLSIPLLPMPSDRVWLPPSPVVQAALVVDPTDSPEES